MKFALNYSPQAMTLLQNDEIEIDLFKVSADFPEHVSICKNITKVMIHFSLMAGAKQPETNFLVIEDLLSRTETKYVNVHLGATAIEYPHIPVESNESQHRDEFIEEALRDLSVLINHFGSENVILENWPYHATMRSDTDILNIAVEPQTIRTVINESGCGFLFDIDHAIAAANARNEDFKEYIAQLPLDKICEFHMTGSRMFDGYMQSHFEMQKSDWELLDWSLSCIKNRTWSTPNTVAFEYGGVGPAFEHNSESDILKEQVPKFMEKIKNLRQNLANEDCIN